MEPRDIDRLREAARGYAGASLIVLFGSVARGEGRSESDADIAVAGLDFWRALDAGADIAALLGREPHVVELERASDWLRFQVAREGILLAEERPGAWAEFQARAALAWFDLAPLVARCAAGARAALGRRRG